MLIFVTLSHWKIWVVDFLIVLLSESMFLGSLAFNLRFVLLLESLVIKASSVYTLLNVDLTVLIVAG
jgi:hypothetical protein